MIIFDSVYKKYSLKTYAVKDISFIVEDGDFFALLGPNGAGKTTLLKLLLDFIKPTKGIIKINGLNSKYYKARRGIGYLSEDFKIPFNLTGLEFLNRQAELCNISRAIAKNKIFELLEFFGISGIEKKPVKTYSKGMLKRIGIASAFLCATSILILDEPTADLDALGIIQLRKALESLKQKITVILNSHFLSEVEKICTTFAIINNGKIVFKDKMHSAFDKGESLEDIFIKYVTKNNA
jgi:ABC-2 type transport system ATP-binding protein